MRPPNPGNAADQAIALWAREWALDVYRYCRRFLADDSEAEDVMQLVFIQALQSHSSYRAEAPPLQWLLSIARNRCLDRLRITRRAPETTELTGVANFPALLWPIDEALARSQAAEQLTGCLDGLTDSARAAVVMHYHDGLTYEEIEQLTGSAAGTLRVRVMRALPVLKVCLEAKGVQW